MYLSIFSDELGIDISEGAAVLREWGLSRVDLRGRVLGRHFEGLDTDELRRLRSLLDDHGLRVGCLESSLAKVHLPDAERQRAEAKKLERIIEAAEIFDCRLVRAFFYWQPQGDLRGRLAVMPDQLQRVLDTAGPLIERATASGLTLAFENCGVSVEEVFAVLEALDNERLALAWDCANEWFEGNPPDDAAIAERIRRTRVVHVKARGAVQGLAEIEVPWGRLLFALASGGFDGPVSIETHNPDKSVADAEVSRRVLESLCRAWPGGAPVAGPRPRFDFDPVRFVVVGLGMGRPRAKQIQQTDGTELAGVCDLDEERARAAGEELGVEWTTELAPWLERDDVDVVFVVTPTGVHAEPSVAALEAGKHVICTKPMEVSVEACNRMIEAARGAGRLLAVDFSMRLEPSVQRFRQRVAAGDLGEILGGTLALKIKRTKEYFGASGGWRGTRRLDGGGVMSNQAIHHLDELIYILGMPGRVSMRTWTQRQQIEAEDLGSALWEYADGAVVQIYATTTFPANSWYFDMELHGTRGAAVRKGGGPFVAPVERWFTGDAWEETLPEPEMPPWESLAQNLADAIRTGAPLVCDGPDGRRSRIVLDAMYASAEQDGAWVKVVEPER